MRSVLTLALLSIPAALFAAGPPLLTAPFPLSSFELVGDRAVFIQHKQGTAELWATDGTAAGTVRLPLGCDDCPFLRFVAHDGSRLFFNLQGRLGITDGTPEGTLLLQEPGEAVLDVFPFDPLFVGSRLFFAGEDAAGVEPWVSDGTAEGTGRILDLRSAPEGSLPNPGAVLNDRLFFAATDELGQEPWLSDGTPEGTFRIADLDPGPESSIFFLHAGLRDDLAVFFADAPGRELWRTDATEDGTFRISDFRPDSPDGAFDVSDFFVVGDQAFFTAVTTISFVELWITDGSAEGTRRLTRFEEQGGAGDLLGVSGDRLVFTARFGDERWELWTSDGTVDGTRRLVELCDSPCRPNPRTIGHVRGLLYLRVDEPTFGSELWFTDGTSEGTHVVNLCPGPCSSDPKLLIPDPDVLYVVADDGVHGRELYRIVPAGEPEAVPEPLSGGGIGDSPPVLRLTDFTIPEPFVHRPPFEEPTFPNDIPPSTEPIGPFRGVVLPDGRLLFAATDVGEGFALFTSDGTPEGLEPFFTLGPATQIDVCEPGAETLCLTQDRFRVEVDWHDPRSGDSGSGNVLPGTTLDDSGFFWFFDPANVELIVKVLDARPVNGHFWVFTGSLTDVERRITVTDTVTGQVNVYERAAGNPTGHVDVTAFE